MMFAIQISRSIRAAAVFAVASLAVFASEGRAQYSQGFETDTSSWSGSITRVASGTGGITSSDGSFHAVIDQGPFTNSGTSHGDPWSGQVLISIDVYVDTTQATVGDGWAWDTGISDQSTAFVEGGGFGAEKTAAGAWSFAPDGDGAAYPGGGYTTSTTGWYRFVSEWGDNGSGLLTRNSYIYDSLDQQVYSNLQTTSHSTANLSSRHYSWFPVIDAGVGTLAIDNATAVVPEPAALGLLGIGAAAMLLRRRRA